MANDKEETTTVRCNACRNETRHTIVASRTTRGSETVEDGYEVDWKDIFEMLQCRGCDEICMRRRSYFSEWGPGDVVVAFYPPRVARSLPAWTNKLTAEFVSLLKEVYQALQADSRSLAMMGARALIDMVMLKEVGDVGSFAQKLSALQDAGFVSKKHRVVLEAALDAGNAASHRGHRPSPEVVSTVIDIVEHLMQATVLQSAATDLKRATPKRRRQKKRSNK